MARGSTRFAARIAAGAMLLLPGICAIAQSPGTHYTGKVIVLEVWRSGNIVFKLDAAGVPCNEHFVLNKSDAGTKDFYAMLLTAKSSERTVRAYFDVCGPAEGSGGNYALIQFLRLN